MILPFLVPSFFLSLFISLFLSLFLSFFLYFFLGELFFFFSFFCFLEPLLFIYLFIFCLCIQYGFFDSWAHRLYFRYCGRFRSSLCALVFNKTLLLNISSNSNNISSGRLLTLISNDCKMVGLIYSLCFYFFYYFLYFFFFFNFSFLLYKQFILFRHFFVQVISCH
jgi:hypothetical protein